MLCFRNELELLSILFLGFRYHSSGFLLFQYPPCKGICTYVHMYMNVYVCIPLHPIRILINATHWINVFTAFGCYIGFGARGGAAA